MSEVAIREGMQGATETALILPDGLSEDEWEHIGSNLGQMARASCWWIGDWINYGEDVGYVSREKYDRAVALTGLARGTLRNYAHICRKIDSSLRSDDLSFAAQRAALERGELVEKPLAIYEVQTERQGQIAAAAARRVYAGLSAIQGYCIGLDGVVPERALAGASPDDIAAWDSLAADAMSTLRKLRQAVRKGAVKNGS